MIGTEQGNQACELFVGNLTLNVTDSELKGVFNQYGSVKEVYVEASQGGRNKIGFVTMSSPKEAELCIRKVSGTELKGRFIVVGYSLESLKHMGPTRLYPVEDYRHPLNQNRHCVSISPPSLSDSDNGHRLDSDKEEKRNTNDRQAKKRRHKHTDGKLKLRHKEARTSPSPSLRRMSTKDKLQLLQEDIRDIAHCVATIKETMNTLVDLCKCSTASVQQAAQQMERRLTCITSSEKARPTNGIESTSSSYISTSAMPRTTTAFKECTVKSLNSGLVRISDGRDKRLKINKSPKEDGEVSSDEE